MSTQWCEFEPAGLRMLLAESEPSKIRWRLADFYDATIDANMPESTRLAYTIQTW